MGIYSSVDQLIGGTPLLELCRLERQLDLGARVLVKLESFNPGGSVKDRVAKAMLDDAEASGRLAPGGTIVEPTSGNTGIGLASVAAARGYRVIIVMPETMSAERRALMRAYGAELVLTEGARGMAGAIEKANELVNEIPGAILAGQFTNPANPAVHEATTGPEIWRDTEGNVDLFVAGVGTGGTITGTGRYLKEVSGGAVTVIGADPEGSVFSSGQGHIHPFLVEGAGKEEVPEVYDPSVVDRIVAVPDDASFEMTRRLAREEGLLVGGSSGMAVAAAIRYARERDLDESQLMVVLLPDSGRGYMSKIFNDDWMRAHGFGDVVERTSAPALAAQYR